MGNGVVSVMDWGDIAKIALTSGISAALVSSGANYFLKKQDYKRDYYKKIIDKRLQAYAELETFLGNVAVTREILNALIPQRAGTGFFIFDCFYEINNLNKALEAVNDVINKNIWYAHNIQKDLSDLNTIFVKALTTIEYPNEANLDMYNLKRSEQGEYLIIKIGKFVKPEMDRCFRDIEVSIKRDLLEMDDVEAFLKSAKTNR